MQPGTLATLKELDDATWFARVGEKDLQNAAVVSSWDEAMRNALSPEWGDLLMEAMNQYRERLAARSPARFARWNDVVIEVKQSTVPMVQRKIADVIREHRLPGAFAHLVQWSMLGVCMEAEYADIHPPGFFAGQAFYYVRGHYPCGWQGHPPPAGRPVVF